MTNGQIVLNGITEGQLILILQEKERMKRFSFAVQPLVSAPLGNAPPNKPPIMGYNNAVFSWGGDDGLKAVMEVVEKLLHHPDRHPATP